MDDIRIVLSFMWVALMLTYLLGDVLRIFSDDATPGEISGQPVSQGIWLGLSIVMVLPVLMILVSLLVTAPAARWASVIVAAFFFLFNLVGLPTYASYYDQFLIVVSLAINVLIIWLAWNWDGASVPSIAG